MTSGCQCIENFCQWICSKIGRQRGRIRISECSLPEIVNTHMHKTWQILCLGAISVLYLPHGQLLIKINLKRTGFQRMRRTNIFQQGLRDRMESVADILCTRSHWISILCPKYWLSIFFPANTFVDLRNCPTLSHLWKLRKVFCSRSLASSDLPHLIINSIYLAKLI